MKLIFLDIDGVLNSDEWYDSPLFSEVNNQSSTNGAKFTDGGEYARHIDPRSWKLINDLLVDDNEIKLVMISSWRSFDLDSTKEFYRGSSISYIIDKLIGVTPRLDGCRGDEVAQFLDSFNHKVDSYVIIDDYDDFLLSQRSRLVRIDPEFGLREYHLDLIINILDKQL